jgi:uncharacterized membrane protein
MSQLDLFPAPLDDAPAPLVGLVSGLAAGLVAAYAMTKFQTFVGEAIKPGLGGTGTPSTETAADRASKLLTGKTIPKDRRPAAGEAVHYIIGSLVGGLYGLAAERQPKVAAGHGAVFGVTAATVLDEAVVPATGLGPGPTKAPLTSHPYSYASHLVFGVVTEGARKLFRRFFIRVRDGIATLPFRNSPARHVALDRTPDDWRTIGLAFLLGATAGPRTSAPVTAVTWAARLGWIDLRGSKLAFLASPWAVAVTTPMALGELVIDKLPATPSRTQPAAIAARAASGALAGAALGAGRPVAGLAALAGAVGATAGALLGHALRLKLAKAAGKDWPVAVTEDALAGGGALLVALASLAPARDPARNINAAFVPSGRMPANGAGLAL